MEMYALNLKPPKQRQVAYPASSEGSDSLRKIMSMTMGVLAMHWCDREHIRYWVRIFCFQKVHLYEVYGCIETL